MITRFGEGCWNLWWTMTADDGVWVVILGLAEIVQGIRVFSQERRSIRSCKGCDLSPNDVPTYPIYRDQARRSSWGTSNLIRIGFSFPGSSYGPPPQIRRIWASGAQPPPRSMELGGLTSTSPRGHPQTQLFGPTLRPLLGRG